MGILHLLNIKVAIQRPTTTQGPYGEEIKDWSDISSDVACRIQRKSPNQMNVEVVLHDKETVVADYNLYFESSVDIQQTDRVNYDSRVFLVLRSDDENQMSHHIKVDALEIV